MILVQELIIFSMQTPFTPISRQCEQGCSHHSGNPLDILVSAYYSHRYSHPTEGWPDLSEHRRVLAGLDKTAGLALEFAYMFAHNFQFSNKPGVVPPFAAYERWDWDDPRILTVRMEDLTQTPDIVFARMFEHCGKVLPPHFDEAILLRHLKLCLAADKKGSVTINRITVAACPANGAPNCQIF